MERSSLLRNRYWLVALLVLAGWVVGLNRAAEAPPRLVIQSATYGDLPDGKSVDVTAKVAALVKDNSLSVAASSSVLGNPAEGVKKKLKVGYTLDGLYHSKTVDEGEVLDISSRLTIRKAVYGDIPSGPQADVTDIVADLVRRNALSVKATNDLFTDTAAGVVKHLRVDYTYDGVEKSVTVNENDTLTLPQK